MLADLTDAINFVSEEVEKYGGDGQNIVPLGLSAGIHVWHTRLLNTADDVYIDRWTSKLTSCISWEASTDSCCYDTLCASRTSPGGAHEQRV